MVVNLGNPIINNTVRHAIHALHQDGLLGEFHTTIETSNLAKLALPAAFQSEFRRRALPRKPGMKVVQHPNWEIIRIFTQMTGIPQPNFLLTNSANKKLIDRALAKSLSLPGTRAVYGYEGSCIGSFKEASNLGLKKFLDLQAVYWRAGESLLAEERELKPDWALTMPPSFRIDAGEQTTEEIDLADHIFVASTFAEKAFREFYKTPKKLHVVQYGAPTVATNIIPNESGKLKVLFVGGLSQLKGMSYFFEAVAKLLPHIEVTVVGRKVGESATREAALENVNYIASAPNDEILRIMRANDVLVFPSLFDGFGLVILEALSQGIPVIASTNSGGPDIVTNGENGWTIPIRNSDVIFQHLETLVFDRALLHSMKENALASARNASWEMYERTLLAIVSGSLRDG